MTEKQNCGCLECRLRATLGYDAPKGIPFMCDTGEALIAMGNIMAELLAHHSTKSAKHFADELLKARKKWMQEPRVMAQGQQAGNA